MELFNLIAKGVYLLLQWYFGSEMVKDFLKELQTYMDKKTAAKALTAPESEQEKDSKTD